MNDGGLVTTRQFVARTHGEAEIGDRSIDLDLVTSRRQWRKKDPKPSATAGPIAGGMLNAL